MAVTVTSMTPTPAAKFETFSFDRKKRHPKHLSALQLVYSSPRVFDTLVDAWDVVTPGTRQELERLTSLGLVKTQPAIRMDIRTGKVSTAQPKSVDRWCATASGRRLSQLVAEDSRVLLDTFPFVDVNEERIATLLSSLVMSDQFTKVGISVSHLSQLTGLSERHVRWWLTHLGKKRLARKLKHRLPDVRTVVPQHWRATKTLTRQINSVAKAFPATTPHNDIALLQVNRAEFLTDITPSRVNLSGATDYEHDITVQNVLAEFLTSPSTPLTGTLRTEPRFALPATTSSRPWVVGSGDEVVIYQPDAVFTHQLASGVQQFSVVEYERFQTRKDGWIHLEKFIAARNTAFSHFDDVTIRFVLPTKQKEAGYTRLCEAFATWVADYSDYLPLRRTHLMVSSVERVTQVPDPLHPKYWARLELPAGNGWEMVLHTADFSPYKLFF